MKKRWSKVNFREGKSNIIWGGGAKFKCFLALCAKKFYPPAPPPSQNLVYALGISRNCIICGHIVTNLEPIYVLWFEEFVFDADIFKVLSQIPTSNKTKSSLIIGGCVKTGRKS